MIVYGDPCFEATTGTLVARLRCGVSVLSTGDPVRALDGLRNLLIQAGQLEQGGQDAPAGAGRLPLRKLEAITDRAAEAFVPQWTNVCGAGVGAGAGDGAADRVAAVDRALDALSDVPDAPLRVKVPEGFAFYALYPEQYCAAAARWCDDHAGSRPGPVAVVGIRSIGTTLSAVVAATLASRGWEVCRVTVRPTGHPFDRRAEIDAAQLRGAARALVVDEGPGISGSSMAAVGAALAGVGVARDRISFLPGHAGEPGSAAAASDAVRAWWATTRRYVSPLADLRWRGRPLPEALAAVTGERCGGQVERVDDLSGGAWRQAVYAHEQDWPAVCAPFERTKYRCVLRDGRAVMWKFAGLAALADGTDGAGAEHARRAALAARGWTAAPVGSAYGFVGVPWVDGRPLRPSDADAPTLATVGRYLNDAAGLPLSAAEQVGALARLADLLYWNTWEALGEPAAQRARRWCDAAERLQPADPVRGYGDGRMAPHEWLRTSDGRLFKTDCAGHDCDHTATGRQPLAWDLAGALVEWSAEGAPADALVTAAGASAASPPPLLDFHRLAYAAFRMGQCTLCAGTLGQGDADRGRLERAAAFYRSELERRLAGAIPA